MDPVLNVRSCVVDELVAPPICCSQAIAGGCVAHIIRLLPVVALQLTDRYGEHALLPVDASRVALVVFHDTQKIIHIGTGTKTMSLIYGCATLNQVVNVCNVI